MRAEWAFPLIAAFTSRPWHLMLVALMMGGFFGPDRAPAVHAADFDTMSAQSGTPATTSEIQESFLQQFISRSLIPEPPAQAVSTAPKDEPQVRSETPPLQVAVAPPPLEKSVSSELTAAATKMILALAAILCFLIGAAYLARRFIFNRMSSGSSEQLLRVVAKVPLTTKCMLVLVEVPGKSILIGVNGTTLTALGEVESLREVAEPVEAEESVEAEQEAETEAATRSFAESLKQYTQNQATQDQPEDGLLSVEEVIQKKVSSLKRL